MESTRRIEPFPDLWVPNGCVEVWKLTPRQVEVLRCLCAGLANKEIARVLDISVATTVAHVRAILERSCSNTRLEVLAKVLAMSQAQAGGRPLRTPDLYDTTVLH